MPFKPGSPMSMRMMSGAFLAANLDGVGAAFGFGHHLEVIAVAQDGLDAVAHDLVIVDEQNLKWHCSAFRVPRRDN